MDGRTTVGAFPVMMAAGVLLLGCAASLLVGCDRGPRTWSLSVRNESDRKLDKVYLQYRGVRSIGAQLGPSHGFVASGEPGPVPEKAVLVWQWAGDTKKRGMRVPIGQVVRNLGDDTLEFRFNADGTVSLYVRYLGTLQDSGELFRGRADPDVVIDPQPPGWE